MGIDYEKLMTLAPSDVAISYSDRVRRLYALSVVFGEDGENPAELAYVTETAGHSTVPAMAPTLCPPSFLRESGWHYQQVLHGEQKLQLYRPLPATADLLINYRVDKVVDRGPGRGAIICTSAEARLRRDDTALFTASWLLVARGDGGFGGPKGEVTVPHELPDRAPDLSCDIPTRADQALLFRLNGDTNPLHADHNVAKSAGFPKPILHGLCTYGIACRAVLQTICEYDFTLIEGFDVRFSEPVYPGEQLRTEMWQDRNVVSFRCRATERDVVVLDNGKCTLAG